VVYTQNKHKHMANILHIKQEDPKKGSKAKKALAIFGVVLLLAGVIGLGMLLRTWQNQNAPPPTSVVIGESQNKTLTGDFEGGQAEIDKALQRQDLSDEDKYMLYYQKGTNYQNTSKFKEAMEQFKIAEGYKKTYSLYHSMGMVAEELGDIAGAVAYYEKGMPLIVPPPKNPVAEDDKKYLQLKIDELKKKL
jgi:tetratricopeptide (TPR) repeat protein